ncbi:MAG: putative lipid II flippase FtsW [Eubacteriaceae bacterium]|nr:putative lipid II flippase FtsW [Eubacteriaceae bacterium]
MKSRRKTIKLEKNGMNAGDFTIVLLVTILVIFGIVMVFSASYYKSINDTGSPYAFLTRQAIYAAMGFFLMAFCARFPYKYYKMFSPIIMLGSLVLLILVLTPLGTLAGGATRMIRLGPISIMPGEIAKLGVIIFVSAYLSTDSKLILSFRKGILPMVIVMGITAGLIMKQPNLSTALTVCGIIAGIMFIAGLKWRYVFLALFVAGGGIGSIVLFGDKIGAAAHWKKRILSFVDPFEDPLGDGFQVVQSLLALGSGGLFGLGLGKSLQKNLYLPEPQNDFILAIIGEELGFVGLLALLAVYLILIWRCFHVCLNAPDRFSMLMCGGITIMLALQVIFNVAVVTSSMPPTGVALPFISYGGNSLWIFMASMGIVLNVSKKSRHEEEQK